jgi:YegS/Rv2252/BmrU family lipid kinase
MIRISQDKQRFICIGGDGTINEIANSAPGNTNVEFGVIPNGSGNDFVRNFTGKKNFYDIDAQIDGTAVALDLIKCNEYYCVNMVNIGFDCAVVKEADKLKKVKFLTPGISYILGVFVVLFRKFGTKMRLVFDDGEIIEKEFTLTAIGNGKFCGGGFMAAPRALLNDGLLDICAVDKISRLTFIKLVGSYKKGTHLINKGTKKVINYRRTSHFKMEFEAPLPICIDGEIKGAKSVDFSIVPGGFNFVVPKDCELKYR